METCSSSALRPGERLVAFFDLCKPRVNTLIVFTAMIGMWLAAPQMDQPLLFFIASLGIALVAAAAAAVNCLVERTVDARMARTMTRATARGSISTTETLLLSFIVGGAGLLLLHTFVNDLTMWLTLATFLGYAVIYTLLLKPATPMNIVIGGASGAMPPVLGWTAMTGQITPEAISLFLIIFLWTPPHFWALACYRRDEYALADLPMLPVTHGVTHTCRQILAYTVLLCFASVLPAWLGDSGWLYLSIVAVLNVIYLAHGVALTRRYSDALAKRAFTWSIIYLTLLFAALLLDRLL